MLGRPASLFSSAVPYNESNTEIIKLNEDIHLCFLSFEQ